MTMRKTDTIVDRLKALGSLENVAGMARFGITPRKAFGISAPVLKNLGKEIKGTTDDRHGLALALFSARRLTLTKRHTRVRSAKRNS